MSFRDLRSRISDLRLQLCWALLTVTACGGGPAATQPSSVPPVAAAPAPAPPPGTPPTSVVRLTDDFDGRRLFPPDNWWNQEIFGRPTTLPWGLEIDVIHRPVGMERFATFHPAFLYESLWNLGLCGVLLVIDRRFRLARGQLVWLYVGGYGLGRLWVESLRIDDAARIGGIRVNILMSLFAIAAGIVGFVVQGRRGAGRSRVGSDSAEVARDGVVEGGPSLDCPGAEAMVGE